MVRNTINSYKLYIVVNERSISIKNYNSFLSFIKIILLCP